MLRYCLCGLSALIVASMLGGCITTLPAPPAPPVAETPPPPAPPPPAPVAAPAPVAEPAPAPAAAGPTLYELWYATNRAPVTSSGLVVNYADGADGGRVHYGKIFADIPEDFLRQHNRTHFWDRLFPSAEADLLLTKPVEIDAQTFVTQLKTRLDETPDKQMLVYLHGFNTTFKEAAQRAASIGYQLKMPATAFFSWPSQGRMASYLADKDAAANSEDAIADFLIKVNAESGAQRIHLIAHSMGNQALLGAMYRPKMQQALKNGLRFGQIILAAPDVDTERFMRDAAIFTTVADRVSLYVSDGDKALLTSRRLAANRPRAGLRPPVVVVDKIDTVDVSATNLTLLGHAFVEAEIAVLNDMYSLVWHNDPPARRSRLIASGKYWLLQ